MTVGERIKQRRKELGLSADELAEKLNKNRATVYRYENSDIERIPAEVLKPLSEILQVSPEYLMGWSEEDEKNGLDRLVRDIEKDKNMLLRAAAGGLLFGGAGAVVGAMTALKPSTKVIKGKKDTYILIVLRNGKRFVLKPALGYEFCFNHFCKKFREVQRLGVAESSIS